VDQAGLDFLAGVLRPLATRQDQMRDQIRDRIRDGAREGAQPWDALPLTLRFAVGWVDLPTRILADTVARDVIMLDECWLREDDGIMVQVGRTSAFRAVVRGTALTVAERLGEIMADTLESGGLDEPRMLDDVTVRLTFDLGERSVTLGELKSLAPGFTFDLGRDLRRVVTIRANGMPIGEGELVDIEGRVGVSVLTLHRFGE
jgi:type III secretion protein Q